MLPQTQVMTIQKSQAWYRKLDYLHVIPKFTGEHNSHGIITSFLYVEFHNLHICVVDDLFRIECQT